MKLFELVGAADRTACTFSGGMRRRLDVASSLVAAPPVLFLDEPATVPAAVWRYRRLAAN